MKRVFLCAERFFPRGDAGANRVLYMAKALQNKGWKTIVFSIGKNYEDDRVGNQFYREGIQYENIVCKTRGKVQKVERLLLNGSKTVALLKKYKLADEDKVYIYSSTAQYTSAVLKYAKKCGAPVITDVVEWHQPFQFKYGKYDLRYKSFMECFDKWFPKSGNIIAISEMLKKHFEDEGCSVLKLPIYIEANENYCYNPEEEKLNLIYPGNPYRKDSLKMMLEALNLLTDEEKKRVCLHLTGVTRQLLSQSVPGEEELLDLDCVKIHGWMEYTELMTLYQLIDFALIARPDNVVTQANFPSKVPELMNRGIPVIINSIGDIREYLTSGKDAIFIEETTSEACCEMIKQCLKKEKKELIKMHDAAFESAKRLFDYKQSETKLDNFFNAVK